MRADVRSHFTRVISFPHDVKILGPFPAVKTTILSDIFIGLPLKNVSSVTR